MLYSSLPFLFVFLPVVLIAYFVSPHRLRNAVLVVASLVFYAWGGSDFVAILLGFIITHWLSGCALQRLLDRGRSAAVRTLLASMIVADVLFLAWFKYANFTVSQVDFLLRRLGLQPFTRWHEIVLPIGISFFTFQAISYLVDVAKGRVRALAHPLDFALYKAFFPQLIAGPIVRYSEIGARISHRTSTWDDFACGIIRFSHGLAKKVLIADPVSLWANAAFANPSIISAAEAWIGATAYMIQIYFDFSGYSDMAIGLARMFGFRLPENFNRPYSAHTLTDFWRRWHMTLTRWFRDYVYIPLGGSRGGPAKTLRNLLVVFVATGVWHGANWTFLAWGLWHGAWLMGERFTAARETASVSGRARTLLVVLLGWVVFRASSLSVAGGYLQAMFGFGHSLTGVSIIEANAWYLPIIAFSIGLVLIAARSTAPWGWSVSEAQAARLRPTVAAAYAGVASLAVVNLLAGSASPFLYFRF